MSNELLAVIVGGSVGILGSLLTTLLGLWWSARRTRSAISNAIIAQLEFAKDKAHRYKQGDLSEDELKAGRPLFKALADNVGYLSAEQATESSKALLMYFEFAQSGKITRADEVIAACTQALKLFKAGG